jgi:DNA polymerase sigma
MDFLRFSDNVGVDDGVVEKGNISFILPTLITKHECPWMNDIHKSNKKNSSPPFVKLHNEIITFCDYISPTRLELKIRNDTINEIKEIVTKLWPSSTLHVFGSQLTNILTPTSDLDLAILGVPIQNDKTEVNMLEILANKIQKEGNVTYVEVLRNAKVPIVKLDHKSSGISIDICINNSSGIDTGE